MSWSDAYWYLIAGGIIGALLMSLALYIWANREPTIKQVTQPVTLGDGETVWDTRIERDRHGYYDVYFILCNPFDHKLRLKSFTGGEYSTLDKAEARALEGIAYISFGDVAAIWPVLGLGIKNSTYTSDDCKQYTEFAKHYATLQKQQVDSIMGVRT